MPVLYSVVLFVHVLTVVFMAAPLYNLIVVTERARFGKAHVQVDRYVENIIRGNSTRCYIYQLTALATGIILWALSEELTLSSQVVLLAKLLLLFLLMAFLSIIHFQVQPAIDKLLSGIKGTTIPENVQKKIAPLRAKRKKLAASCLLVLIVIIMLAFQIHSIFPFYVTAALILLAGLFSYGVYKKGAPYGWF